MSSEESSGQEENQTAGNAGGDQKLIEASPAPEAEATDSQRADSPKDGVPAESLQKPSATQGESPVRTEAAIQNEARISPYQKDMRWYVVQVYSSFEMKAKQTLEERVRMQNLEDYFGEIRVPQETVVELVKGQKKTSNRKFFPGYILVQMVLNEDTWHFVKETPKVSSFLGDATAPVPLSEDEVQRIVSQVEEGSAAPRSRKQFEQGETVKVIDGPFAEFNGTVEEVRADKGKVRVSINIFGRATPLELDFIQVEKS